MPRSLYRLEVRCCCDASRLLGWFNVPELPKLSRTNQLSFPLRTKVDPLSLIRRNEPIPPRPTKLAQVTLPLGIVDLGSEGGHVYPALKADHVDIETLRRIPGFIECPTAST